MQVDIPAVKTEDEIPVSVEGVATTVSDSAAFMKFAHTLMGSEDLEVEISGKTKIRIGKLAPKVNYNEKVPMKGMPFPDFLLLSRQFFHLRWLGPVLCLEMSFLCSRSGLFFKQKLATSFACLERLVIALVFFHYTDSLFQVLTSSTEWLSSTTTLSRTRKETTSRLLSSSLTHPSPPSNS